MINLVKITTKVLNRLSKIDYEKTDGSSNEQLIFPNKIQQEKDVKRVSEQELRLLFIEEFKKDNENLFYSIETPTEEKYKFGNSIEVNQNGRSASLDMCVFEKNSNQYKRILNIEFKHQNAPINDIAKDVLKLIHEKQNGAFIFMLDNTNKGTLCNKNKKMGLFNKLYKSFNDFKKNWNNDDKTIHLIVLSLKQKILIHRKICKADLGNLENIFFIDEGCENIPEIKDKEWGESRI